MEQISKILIDWRNKGQFISFGPSQLKIFVRHIGNAEAKPERTLLLLHGFPESSFSYHLVLDALADIFDQIILFDMVGYGWSDKPIEHFSYSLIEQADIALSVWKHFGISGGHILSHDMGDSVLTELLARSELGLLPSWFSSGFKSLTFTNGSMVLGLAKLRITQKLLLSRFGPSMKNILSYKLSRQQIKSAHGNNQLSEQQIKYLWEAITINDGHRKTYLTIKYLNDRKQFEKTRWLPALGSTKIPIHLAWGDADKVARVTMAHFLKKEICPSAKLTIMEGLGHFCQLGSPEAWIKAIGAYYKEQGID